MCYPLARPKCEMEEFPRARALAPAFLHGELVTNVSSFYLPPSYSTDDSAKHES